MKFCVKKHFKTLLSLTYTFVCIGLYAQELPPINIYTPQQYGGENQNWAISQAKDKTIYVANNAGLLETSGEHWNLYKSPNESIMRSVTVVDDYIYTGCYMEFGYWQKNNKGVLKYTSLSNQLKTSLIEDEQFWNIIALDSWLLFQSLNRIYIYNTLNSSFKIIESKTAITKMYKVGNAIYFQKTGDGIYEIESGNAVLVNNHEKLKSNVVVNMFKQENAIYIQTQDDGFYVLKNGAISPWTTPINDKLKELSVYNSTQLKNGDFAIGTISNGIIIITPTGKIKYKIDQAYGLSNNTILALYEDIDKNIWLGLDNGINCLNMESPFKEYKDDKGKIGAVYAAAIFKNNLYLGTNQGLFYKKNNSNDAFTFIKETQGQVWSLIEHNNTLFCGHNSGTFIIKNNKAHKIANKQGTWNIKAVNDSTLIQGNYDGLYVLKNKNEEWQYSHKVKGFNISSRYFEFINKTHLLVNHEYRGVLKVELNNALTEVVKMTVAPIKKGAKSSLSKYNNEILYSYKEGVFKYDSQKQKFKKDTFLTKIYETNTFVSGKLIAEPKTKRLWSFSRNSISFISPGKLTDNPEVTTIPLPYKLRESITSYENILSINDQNYLLGTTSGYILINLGKTYNKPYKTTISMVAVNNQRINNESQLKNKHKEGIYSSDENTIEIAYSIAEYNKFVNAEYQYQLIGFYDEWSEWSSNSKQIFENLPSGDYTFNVRGRINNVVQNTTSYSFKIKQPWYFSNTMIVIYIIALLLFSLLMHNIYKVYYKKQRQRLIKEKNKELELKKLENDQQLMSFRNEQLKQDIENKNRELAISTMSLIKKNEFLNSIKSELTDLKVEKSIKPVINIIDKNLNSTDDWKLFQEAFNNADKDFLKKIKTIHPSLTPNDLRLCAYLRLNLSSKEIAPLLNISHRSVEVKRYRLRKKMELSHETSLTNYIIGL